MNDTAHVSKDGLIWEEVTDERLHQILMHEPIDYWVDWSNEAYSRYVRSGNARKLIAAGLTRRLPTSPVVPT